MNSHEIEMMTLVQRFLPIEHRGAQELRAGIRAQSREGQTWFHVDSICKVDSYCILMGENEISPFVFVIADDESQMPGYFEGAPLPPMPKGVAMHGACSEHNAAFLRKILPNICNVGDAAGTVIDEENKCQLEKGCTSKRLEDQALFARFTRGDA